MNNEDYQDWKNHPITKIVLTNIDAALEDVRKRSPLKETLDQTAMQASYDEGFCEGVSVFIQWIEIKELNMESENED